MYQRRTSHIVVDDGEKVNLILTLLWHKSKWKMGEKSSSPFIKCESFNNVLIERVCIQSVI